ncbi:NAD(P)/FAD-dependent oxidoreductase [Halotalea alkalilenta]|uniref:NAD(P)/FAD-dependent oxidoreductase n=1 Tax=Halotalea alkalilenta TaxID=376489 RepID=UPI0004875996|nr:FAD/NAD(P)-binding oxidoreductase [Halotalea alkalilenta]
MNERLPRECELLIVGAGPAGMAAACAAADHGMSVVVIDDNPAPGGQIWRAGPRVDLPLRAQALRERFERLPGLRLCSATRVIDAPAPGRLLVEREHDAGVIDYHRLLLCTGARERLLPFPGWTLPGVTGAGGLQALIKGGLTVRGERIAIAGSGPLLLACAATVRAQRGRLVALAEQSPWQALAGFTIGLWRWPAKLAQAIALANPRYRAASRLIEALGERRLEAVVIESLGERREIACDRLACGFGLVANTELAQLLGCALDERGILVDQHQATSVAGVYAAGECTGPGGSELALVEGRIAGLAAADQYPLAAALSRRRARWQAFAAQLEQHFALDSSRLPPRRATTLVCRCEEVTLGELEAHSDWRRAKLASRCGMGACQGRVCAAATAQLFGWAPPPPRPPLSPARIDSLLLAGMEEVQE